MNDVLIGLPWKIQVSLASGYVAYLLAYTGIRDHHRAADTTFFTLIFGVFATGVLAFMPVRAGPVVASITAVIASCLAAAIWRKFIRNPLRNAIHDWDISWANDDPSALATLCDTTKHRICQFGVELEDGTWLTSENPAQFEDAAYKPITIGLNGDVAVYLTHIERPGEERRELTSVRDKFYGDRITYIPAGRINRITMRHVRPASRL